MKMNRADVQRVAELAHLELTDAEIETYVSQLDAILSYIDKLKELDVSNVEPMAQVLHWEAKRGAEWRDDTVHPSDVAAAVLEQAPEAKRPYFRVPRVMER
jgi:aspartyl-tRNA(Asn)/glutamyl-tRNA(Gln) amidotransferase subunit C